MNGSVLAETRGRILVVTINRPGARNAVNDEVAQGLLAAVDQLDSDDGLTVGVLTGAGGGFSSGMDLKAYASDGPPQGFGRFVTHGALKPLICAIEGFALAGGLEMALTCDLIVAARGARLGIPETSVGLFAGAGGLMRLPRRVPYGVAMELALTAEPISAEDAHRYGLLARLTEPGEALAGALALAERIAHNAPLAVSASKQLIRQSNGRTESEYWALQEKHLARVFGSDDAREGPRAFAEKRAAVWTGK